MSTFYAKYPKTGGTGGGGVLSLNSLTGDITLVAGDNITITPSGGDTLTIASTASTGANTALSNLSGTAINTDLIFDTGGGVPFVKTKNDSAATVGIVFGSGDSGNDLSGDVFLRSGQTLDATSGNVEVSSGLPTGNGASGDANLRSANTSGAGASGTIRVISGAVSGGGVNSGDALVSTGTSDTGVSGGATLRSGGSGGDSGDVNINSGAAGAASGSVRLFTGTSGTVRGEVVIDGGTHLASDGAEPTTSPSGSAGAGATSVMVANSTDIRGEIVLITGTGTATGQILSVTFDIPYLNIPTVVVVPSNADAATTGTYIDAVSENDFALGVSDLNDATEYHWTYMVIG